MTRFLVRRVLQGLVVLWLITMAVFALFYVAPNNVARTLAGRQASPETVALISHRLGLDEPIWTQYVGFVWRALHGDLGFDYYHQVPVTTIMAQALPVTMTLVLGAAVIWVSLGVTNGVLSAVRPRSVTDRSLTVFALFFYSMPSFFLGLVLLYGLYYQLTLHGLTIFPAGGTRRSPAASAPGCSTWSCPGSPSPWCRPRPTPA
ncbi:ABC transporter permease [Phycicoccus sp. HDW14]|uniref:ABC transporter permease n=1 Tax=Phycicoccus sp. HDW14 TaxID=2714941 RepID=UPI00197C4B81|nr:ABC transporter permease [Phycicoccus sp. HDW14]